MLLVLVLVVAVVQARRAQAEDPPVGAAPLPVDRSTNVKAGATSVYFVDGPQVIPAKAKIRVEPGVRIVGVNEASLDVQGGLHLSGSADNWVVLENVDLSPTTAPAKGLQLSMVSLKRVRIEHTEEQGISGDVTIRNSTFQRDCKVDACLRGGRLTLEIVDSTVPWTLRTVPSDTRGKAPEIVMERCWAKRTEITGPARATFRHTAFEGGLVFRHASEVRIEGCDVTEVLGFHQGPGDTFRKVKLTKCNLFDGCRLVLDRKAEDGAKVEYVKVDLCYFGPREGPGAVTDDEGLAKLVRDDAAYEEQAVVARVAKPQKSKHLFVDYGRLRCAVPPHD